jgi:hypothetical protein
MFLIFIPFFTHIWLYLPIFFILSDIFVWLFSSFLHSFPFFFLFLLTLLALFPFSCLLLYFILLIWPLLIVNFIVYSTLFCHFLFHSYWWYSRWL